MVSISFVSRIMVQLNVSYVIEAELAYDSIGYIGFVFLNLVVKNIEWLAKKKSRISICTFINLFEFKMYKIIWLHIFVLGVNSEIY